MKINYIIPLCFLAIWVGVVIPNPEDIEGDDTQSLIKSNLEKEIRLLKSNFEVGTDELVDLFDNDKVILEQLKKINEIKANFPGRHATYSEGFPKENIGSVKGRPTILQLFYVFGGPTWIAWALAYQLRCYSE